MLAAIAPATTAAFVLLAFCLLLVLVFEFSNGFHNTANAVATVIYTKSLDPVPAVIWSGFLNFAGVMLGGIAVAYTLVELIPPDALTPPDGNPALAVLASLFVSALVWNVSTWYLGIPCSSSHAIVGAILGVAIANSLTSHRGLGAGVDWTQTWSVGKALLFSPIIGFVLAAILFRVVKRLIPDEHLYRAPKEGERPAWWVRGLLIVTCGGVSFAHGSNDGQKSIGLIMLAIIGLVPLHYTINMDIPPEELPALATAAERAGPFIAQFGDDEKQRAIQSTHDLAQSFGSIRAIADIPTQDRRSVRGDVYRVDAELKRVKESGAASPEQKAQAEGDRLKLKAAVEYAPFWVRILSALCLGIGTMVGYKRIVRTIGERIGKREMTPAQGGSAELVGAAVIATAGFHGIPVSTTHIVSSGVAGTMAGDGAGVQAQTVRAIILAWVLTLPATILLAGAMFYLCA